MTTATEALKTAESALRGLLKSFHDCVGPNIEAAKLALAEIAAVEAPTSEPVLLQWRFSDVHPQTVMFGECGEWITCDQSKYDEISHCRDNGYPHYEVRKLFDHAAPVAAPAEPDECTKCYGGDSCRFPLCRPDAEQVEVAADVHASLYGSAEPVAQSAVAGEPSQSYADNWRSMIREQEAFMADSLAQQLGVSFENWRLRYKPAPVEPVADCGPNPVTWTDADKSRLDAALHKTFGTPAPVEPAGAAVDERERLIDDLDWYKKSLAAHSGKLASVWQGMKDAIREELGQECGDEPFDDLHAALAELREARAKLAQQAAAPAWISVEDRVPEVGVTVLVYAPNGPHDYPDDIRISFDCIDPNDEDADTWLAHNEHYEHFCCVAKPEGSIGPSEKAPYTHWMPLPAAPTSPGVAA